MSSILRSMSPEEDLVGLDIGDNYVAAARLQTQSDGRPHLTHAGWVDYEAGAPDKRIAKAVKQLWRKYHFSTYTVCSCLRSPSLNLKVFKYPKLAEKDLEPALRLEAEELLQIPQEKIICDWHVNAKPREPGGEANGGMEGILVAAPRAEMERHLAILEMAGVYPVIFDVGCMAVANLYLALQPPVPVDKGVCIVNLGRESADIVVLLNSQFLYPRTVFSRSAAWENALEYLITNISDLLKFYQFKLRQQPVEKVLLSGNLPTDASLIGRIGAAVALPVERWNPLAGITKGIRAARVFEGCEASKGPIMTTSLGLALRRS